MGGRQLRLGSLGLIAEPGGWSYEPDPEEGSGDTAQRSLVALVRGPRMVVEYYEAGRSRPFVRGAFVAADEVDELLRQTEPKAHDSWQVRVDEADDPGRLAVADAVLRRIREHVRKFRDQLKPAARPAEDVRLPENSNDSSVESSPATVASRRPPNLPIGRSTSLWTERRRASQQRAIRFVAAVAFGASRTATRATRPTSRL